MVHGPGCLVAAIAAAGYELNVWARHPASLEALSDTPHIAHATVAELAAAVLGEVDCRADPTAHWAAQVAALARRLRPVLENHPGVAVLPKTRDLLSPASLDLAEAFLAALASAGLPGREAALAFGLIYDYTLGFGPRRSHVARRAARARSRTGRTGIAGYVVG